MSRRFKDRIIMVTGASSGLGRALCARLGAQGADVVALARDEALLAQTQQETEKGSGRCLCIPFDLTQFEQYGVLFESLKQHIPHLDGLVHAAGDLKRCAPMQYVEAREFRRMLDINLTAPNLLTQALFPLLTQAKNPSVVFVTCDMARQVQANWQGYGLAKAALAQSAAMWQLEHPKDGIRFNAFNPGRMRTSLMARAFPGLDPASIPEPHAAVDACLFLLTDEATDFRGQCLDAAALQEPSETGES